MKTRSELEAAACKGMTNEDLANRGEEGYGKMIMRKRYYAAGARMAAAAAQQLKKDLDAALERIATLEKSIVQLDALSKPVENTAEIDLILSSIMTKH